MAEGLGRNVPDDRVIEQLLDLNLRLDRAEFSTASIARVIPAIPVLTATHQVG